MKYVKQFGIIIMISFVGEVLNYLIPIPVPASIYGMVIMLVLLTSGKLKLESVRDTAIFLIEVMPLMFIPAAVGIIESWDIIKPNVIAYAIITIVSTVLVMAVAGRVTQFVIRHSKKGGKD